MSVKKPLFWIFEATWSKVGVLAQFDMLNKNIYLSNIYVIFEV
jgi:hypothetical protein